MLPRTVGFVLTILIAKAYSSNNPDFTFCTCMKDPAAAKAAYDKTQSDYFAKLTPVQDKMIEDIKSHVEEMHKGDCPYDYYKNRTAKDYTYDMVSLCGGTALRDRFVAIWSTNKDVSDEEACGFFASQGPIMNVYININYKLVGKCDFNKMFVDVIYKDWEECAKKKC